MILYAVDIEIMDTKITTMHAVIQYRLIQNPTRLC